MDQQFTWKAEVVFNGPPEEFEVVAQALEGLRIKISIPEWKDRPIHSAGCHPIPLEDILSRVRLESLAEGMPRMRRLRVKDIAGGIRTAHLHLGSEVVLLDRERFRKLAGLVAQELAERRVEVIEDYIGVMDGVSRVEMTPIQLP